MHRSVCFFTSPLLEQNITLYIQLFRDSHFGYVWAVVNFPLYYNLCAEEVKLLRVGFGVINKLFVVKTEDLRFN